MAKWIARDYKYLSGYDFDVTLSAVNWGPGCEVHHTILQVENRASVQRWKVGYHTLAVSQVLPNKQLCSMVMLWNILTPLHGLSPVASFCPQLPRLNWGPGYSIDLQHLGASSPWIIIIAFALNLYVSVSAVSAEQNTSKQNGAPSETQ